MKELKVSAQKQISEMRNKVQSSGLLSKKSKDVVCVVCYNLYLKGVCIVCVYSQNISRNICIKWEKLLIQRKEIFRYWRTEVEGKFTFFLNILCYSLIFYTSVTPTKGVEAPWGQGPLTHIMFIFAIFRWL